MLSIDCSDVPTPCCLDEETTLEYLVEYRRPVIALVLSVALFILSLGYHDIGWRLIGLCLMADAMLSHYVSALESALSSSSPL